MLIWACCWKFSFSLISDLPRLHFITNFCFSWNLYIWGEMSSGKLFLFESLWPTWTFLADYALKSGCFVVYTCDKVVILSCTTSLPWEANWREQPQLQSIMGCIIGKFWTCLLYLAFVIGPCIQLRTNWYLLILETKILLFKCCVCVCVCVRERERERGRECAHTHVWCAPNMLKLLPSTWKL